MLVPIVPLYINFLGGTDMQVGLVATFFSASSILIRFFIGILFQKKDEKKTLLCGMLLTTAVMALFCLTRTVGGVCILRIAQGLGFGIVTVLVASLAADIIPDSRRGEGIGIFGMGSVIAAAVFPALGLFLAGNCGYQRLFLLATVGPFTACIILLFFSPHSCVKSEVPDKSTKTPVLERFFDRRLFVQMILLVLMGISRSADMNFISLFTKDQGIAHLSWYYAVQTAASLLLRGFIGKIADRKGHIWSIIPGAFASSCYLMILSVTHTPVRMLFAAFFSGVGLGALVPTMQAWLFNSVEPEKRSLASATYYNFYDIGMGIGAVLLGMIAEEFGYSIMFRITVSCPILFLIIYIYHIVKHGNSGSCAVELSGGKQG